MIEAKWWETLYDDLLADMLLERLDPQEVVQTVDFLESALGLQANARIFDQCCGIGSLSLALGQRGHLVEGVDQSASYVERARQRAVEEGLPLDFVAADACAYTARQLCDAAINWWTSFGHGADVAAHRRMLDCAFASLVPGGRFALDTMNAPGILRDFQRDVVTTRHIGDGEVVLHRRSELGLRDGTMEKTWTYHLPDGRRVVRKSLVRSYPPHELVNLFADAGFIDMHLFGGIDGSNLGLDSPRCIVVGRRPA